MELYGTRACFPAERVTSFLRRLLSRWEALLFPPGRTILFSILLIDIAILCLAAVSIIDAIEEKMVREVRPVTVTAVPRPPVPVKKKAFLLVDNFASRSVNCLGGVKEGFANYGARLEDTLVRGDDAGTCLRLAYDVSSPSSQCGYSSEITVADMTQFRRIRFQVRGSSAEEVFRIEMGYGDAVQSKSISRLLPDGLSGEWQTISLPLPVPGNDNSHLRLTFFFEHDQGMPYTGEVYVRNLRLLQ